MTLAEGLQRLEALLAAQRAPVVDHLAPGADIDLLRGLAAACPQVAEQVITWFDWHDGLTQPTLRYVEVFGGYRLLSFQEAVEVRGRIRALEGRFGQMLKPTSVPILRDGVSKIVFVDACADAPTDVYLFDHDNPERPLQTVSPSLGDLVAAWLDLLDAGFWWDPDRHGWLLRSGSPVDMDLLRRAGLVG